MEGTFPGGKRVQVSSLFAAYVRVDLRATAPVPVTGLLPLWWQGVVQIPCTCTSS